MKFLVDQAGKPTSLNNFGYLLVASEDELNAEALSVIKKDFKEWCDANGYELHR